MALPRKQIETAESHLRATDPVLARLIEAYGPCTLGAGEAEPFQVLARSIISQQLSAKAADTIQARVEALLGTPGRLEPGHLRVASPEALRAAGLSQAKARWLQELSRRTLCGEWSFAALAGLDDAAAVEALDALPGVGRWTAEMMLIFALHRLDVFAMGDVGLRRALNRLYNGGQALSEEGVRQISETWAPYRSVASWYLWRVVDGDVQAWGQPPAL